MGKIMRLFLVLLVLAAAATTWAGSPYAVKVPGRLVGKPKVDVNKLKIIVYKANIVSVKPVAKDEAVKVEIKNIGKSDIPANTAQITLFNETTSGLKKVAGSTKVNFSPIKKNTTFSFYCVFNPCYNGSALVVKIINKKNNLLIATRKFSYNVHSIKVTQCDLIKVNQNSHKLVYKVSNPTDFTVRVHVSAQAISPNSQTVGMYNKYIYLNAHIQKQDTYFINTSNFSKVELVVSLPYPYNCSGSDEIEIAKRTRKKRSLGGLLTGG